MSETLSPSGEQPISQISSVSSLELIEVGYVRVGGGVFRGFLRSELTPETDLEAFLVAAAERDYGDDLDGRLDKKAALSTLARYRLLIQRYGKKRIMTCLSKTNSHFTMMAFYILPNENDPSRDALRAQEIADIQQIRRELDEAA